jgi:transposase
MNSKMNQVTENTLVVGMDIAKRVHYACFVDDRGRMIEKTFAVDQSREDFESLYEKICQTMQETKKTEVIVGIEPTGHYWMNLAYFLDQYGILKLEIARLQHVMIPRLMLLTLEPGIIIFQAL